MGQQIAQYYDRVNQQVPILGWSAEAEQNGKDDYQRAERLSQPGRVSRQALQTHMRQFYALGEGVHFYTALYQEKHVKGHHVPLGHLLERLKSYALYALNIEVLIEASKVLNQQEVTGESAREIFTTLAVLLHQSANPEIVRLKASGTYIELFINQTLVKKMTWRKMTFNTV